MLPSSDSSSQQIPCVINSFNVIFFLFGPLFGLYVSLLGHVCKNLLLPISKKKDYGNLETLFSMKKSWLNPMTSSAEQGQMIAVGVIEPIPISISDSPIAPDCRRPP